MQDHECTKTQEALAAYLDGENAALQSREVQAHLAACEDCQAIYAEVQHALTGGSTGVPSSAFAQDGATAPAPEARYWDELPDRVMARIEGHLPPEGKNTVPPAIGLPPKRLRQSWLVRTVAASKTRSLLALTAVIFLVFVVTRTMRESLPEPDRLQALTDAATTPAESGPVSGREEGNTQPSVSSGEGSRAMNSSATTSKQVIGESKPAPEPAGAPMPAAEKAAAPAGQIVSPAPQISSFAENRSQRDDQPPKSEDEVVLVQGEVDKKEAPASAAPLLPMVANEATADRRLAKTAETSGVSVGVNMQPAKMRALSAAGQAAPSTPENSYSQTLWRAQQAATPKAQQIIWQDYLVAASDSAYMKLAIAQLAQSMLAQINLNVSAEQLKSTVQFLEQHESILRPQLGAAKLSSEMQRVKLLQEEKSKR